MPATATVAEFVRLTEQSGLLDKPRLNSYLKKLETEGVMPLMPDELGGLMVRDGMLTSYQAQQLLHGHWHRFTLLGKYRILEVIGVGGMGKVFLCEHMLLRRLVAVKVLPIAKNGNAAVVERFYREARAIASLNHPNIVRCFDIDRDGMLHFMVMEYVDGASLATIISHHGPMDVTRAAHYIAQAAKGLQNAHEGGWIHRDIKPGNLLLERTGVVKILDMGLARLFTDDVDNLTQETSGQTVLGTADYIAPEQAVASHEVDIRADIYSLGATFYFMLTGRTLFQEGTIAQKLIWHQMRDPDPIGKWRREVPGALAAVVYKMLAKDPAKRFQLPAEVAATLRHWTNQPIAPPSPLEMPRGDPLVQGMSSSASAAALAAVSSSIYGNPEGGSMGSAPLSTMDNRNSVTACEAEAPAKATFSSAPRRVSVSAPTVSWLPPGGQTPSGHMETPLSASRERLPAVTQTPRAAPTIRRLSPSKPAAPEALPKTRSQAPPQLIQRRRLLFALLGAAPVLLGGGFAAYYFGTGQRKSTALDSAHQAKSTNQPTSASVRAPLLVTRNRVSAVRNQPNTFDSVERALAHAQDGDRILILDQFYEERLTVDGAQQKLASNITVTSQVPGGKPIVWRLPADVNENGALLTLANVSGLRIEGIAFDGERRIDELIALSGPCADLQLRNLQLSGFRRTAIRLAGVHGDSVRPLSLQQMRIVAGNPGAESALQMDEGPALADCRNVVVRDCRVEGPFKMAVRLNTRTTGIQFVGNRVFRAAVALACLNKQEGQPIGVTLDSNTFCEMEGCFRLQNISVDRQQEARDRLILRNNLFARTKALVTGESPKIADDAFKACAESMDNICDAAMANPWLAEGRMQALTFALPTDPLADATFLRYARSNMLAKSGCNKGPVGAGPAAE